VGDALFNGCYFDSQVAEVLLQPGDLFLFGPVAVPEVVGPAATAVAAMMPTMTAATRAAVVSSMSTEHDLTSFLCQYMRICLLIGCSMQSHKLCSIPLSLARIPLSCISIS
jgi:hypothetical protein